MTAHTATVVERLTCDAFDSLGRRCTAVLELGQEIATPALEERIRGAGWSRWSMPGSDSKCPAPACRRPLPTRYWDLCPAHREFHPPHWLAKQLICGDPVPVHELPVMRHDGPTARPFGYSSWATVADGSPR